MRKKPLPVNVMTDSAVLGVSPAIINLNNTKGDLP